MERATVILHLDTALIGRILSAIDSHLHPPLTHTHTKKSHVWLQISWQFKSQSDSFICLRGTTKPSPSRSSLFLYRNTKLVKVRRTEIHEMFPKSAPRGAAVPQKAAIYSVLRCYFVVIDVLLYHHNHDSTEISVKKNQPNHCFSLPPLTWRHLVTSFCILWQR